MKKLLFLLVLLFSQLWVNGQSKSCRPKICLVAYEYHDDRQPNAVMNAIKQATPDILIDNTPGGYWGQKNGGVGCLPSQYSPLGINVFSYITGGYEGTKIYPDLTESDLNSNLARINAIANDGATGIFLDEVSSFPDNNAKNYILAIYTRCKEKGLKLIINPGVSNFDSWLMGRCDFLMSDEQYDGTRAPSASENPYKSRILVVAQGVSSADRAAEITKGAYANGFGHSYACNEYITVPSWLNDYLAKTDISEKAFELTFINIGQSQSGIKSINDKLAWKTQFITPDAGPLPEKSTQSNPTIYYSENLNKIAPRYWTIHTETCTLGTNGSLTFDMLATPEVGVVRSYNTHENNAPYLMYANREGFTELYAQNHPAYGFYQNNGNGGNTYDTGLPKGLYKLSVRYWDQKGQGSIYPSTRQPAGNVLAYQEYWFRIQSQNGIGTGASKVSASEFIEGKFAQISPNPISNILHLQISEAKGKQVNIRLIDTSGRQLLKYTFIADTDRHEEELEVSHLAYGMYFLQAETVEKQANLKIIKRQ